MNDTALASLAGLLWDERSQLERLLYALVSQQLVITSGQTRWLGHCDADVQAAMTTFRDAEVLRAIEVESITTTLGVPANTTLAELAEATDEPWSQTLHDHRTALRGLMSEIDSAVAENQRLLKAGAQAVGETLAQLGTFSSTYDAHGTSVRRGDGPTFLDEQA